MLIACLRHHPLGDQARETRYPSTLGGECRECGHTLIFVREIFTRVRRLSNNQRVLMCLGTRHVNIVRIEANCSHNLISQDRAGIGEREAERGSASLSIM